MPKISNKSVLIRHANVDKRFEVTVMYSQTHNFYIVIPKDFFTVVHHLGDTERSELGISKKFKNLTDKYSASIDYEALVTGATENQVIDNLKIVLKQLMNKTVKQKNVIMVFYRQSSSDTFNGARLNDEHPAISFDYGLTYAVENTVGETKTYSVYKIYNSHHGERTNRYDINLWHKDNVAIIDDTPDNRIKLEELYNVLKILLGRIEDNLNTPFKLLQFIQSGIKLLN